MNLTNFFSYWPDIIRASRTSEGLIALLILAFVAIGIVVAWKRGKDSPWYAVPILLVVMLIGVLSLASLTIVQRVSRPLSIELAPCPGGSKGLVNFTGRVRRNG
jgi:hypothetical protein